MSYNIFVLLALYTCFESSYVTKILTKYVVPLLKNNLLNTYLKFYKNHFKKSGIMS